MTYVLNGQLVSIGSRQSLSGLRVEAWDKDVVHSDLLGSAVSDAKGDFVIRFDETHFRDHPKDHLPDVFFRVYEGDRLVHTTETSIHQNLPPGTHSFILEIALQSAPSDRYVVSGQVTDSEGQPLPGLLVRAFDRDLRHEELLGQVLTDAQGRYELAYTQQQFRRAEKAQADLVVRVFGPSAGAPELPEVMTHRPPATELPTHDEELVASDIVFNASPRQTVDMTVDIYRHYGVSEYERYLYTLRPLFELEKVALHDLTDEDIRFLNGETGIPFEHLDYLRLDAQWSLRYKLDPAALYGLFRQKLPTNLRRLLSEKPSRLLEVLNASLAGNIIPAALFARIKVILDSLRSLAVDLAFEPEADAKGAPPLGAILATAPLEPALQRRVVEFALRYEGEESIWDALKSEPGITEAALNSARFTLKSSALVFDHVPTLKALQNLKKNKKWKFSSDLVELKREDLARITKQTAAKDLPKGFNNTEALAEAIADRIEQVFPTELIANRLAEDNELGSGDINFFSSANPSFDLLHTSVDTYLNNGAELGHVSDREGLRNQLKTFQRVARLTPPQRRYETMRGLIANGYTSAIKVAQTPKDEFLATVTPVIGEAQASLVFENARVNADAATMTLLNLGDHLVPGPMVLPRAIGELPTWAKLFGSLNNCKCKHCRSVHSPAAYLVDMLEFLRQLCLRKNERGACQQTLLDVLLSRRPDIETILLDCDNANTPLPYIDLVNEILEVAVARLAAIPTAHLSPYQTVGSNEEEKALLRAAPQHELKPTYEHLERDEAVYPWILPFSLDNERVKLFSEHVGIELYRVREFFGRSEAEIARFHLGISRADWSLIAQAETDEGQLARIWNVESLDEAEEGKRILDKVPRFLARSGLSYEELQALVGPEGFLSSRDVSIDTSAAPCDMEQHVLAWPAGSTADRQGFYHILHRFVRLARVLRWSLDRLATVLAARGHSNISTTVLVEISRLVRSSAKLRLPVEQTAALTKESLSRVLRMPLGEVNKLVSLAPVVPPVEGRFSSFSGARPLAPAEVDDFLDARERLQSVGLDAFELAYLLRHEDVVPAAFAPTDEMLDRALGALYAAMRANDSDVLGEAIPPLEDTLRAWVRNLRPEPPETGTLERGSLEAANRLVLNVLDEAISLGRDLANLNDVLPGVEDATTTFRATLGDEIPERETRVGNFRAAYHGVRRAWVDTWIDEYGGKFDSYRSAYRLLLDSIEHAVDVYITGLYVFLEGNRADRAIAHFRTEYEKLLSEHEASLNRHGQRMGQFGQAAIQQLAQTFGLEAGTVEVLLCPVSSMTDAPRNSILHAVDETGTPLPTLLPAISDFIALIRQRPGLSFTLPIEAKDLPEAVTSAAELIAIEDVTARTRAQTVAVQIERDTLAAGKRLLIRLGKTASLTKQLGLTPRELSIIASLPIESGFLDFNALPIGSLTEPSLAPALFRVETLIRAKRLQTEMPKADSDIFDFLAAAPSQVVSLLQANTGWDRDPRIGQEVDFIARLSDEFGREFGSFDIYEKLSLAFAWTRDWRISPDELITLGTDFRSLTEQIEDIAERRHGDDRLGWYKALTPINDRLRERKRDALVAYLLANTPTLRDGSPRWSNANALYADFLIDVEMSACQLTSRIVQANSAIQLFVQRCLMNLEYGVAIGDSDNEHWRQWQWMKNYRVWEANRKVFLFPENWIEPDLRDDKSPFFQELENELLQDDVTQESVERAYRNYLVKLDEVARLDVRGFYEELKGNGGRVLHVIGRTFSEPHIYYYRQRHADRTWTAWEKIDLSIEGDHQILAVISGRVLLFWARFKEVKQDDIKRWEISLSWSEYKNGAWQAAKAGRDKFIEPLLAPTDFTFRLDLGGPEASIEDTQPSILVFKQTRLSGPLNVPDSYSLCNRRFVLDTCKGDINISEVAPVRVLIHPDRVDADGMSFIEDDSVGDHLLLNEGPFLTDTIDVDLDSITKLIEEGGLGGAFVGGVISLVVPFSVNDIKRQASPTPLLDVTPGSFSLVAGHQFRQFLFYQPFFFTVEGRTYFVSARGQQVLPPGAGRVSDDRDLVPNGPHSDLLRELRPDVYGAVVVWPKYQFETFYHPYVCPILERLFEAGLDGVLAPPPGSPGYGLLNRQAGKESVPTRFRSYGPNGRYVWNSLSDTHDGYPYEQFDFSLDGAYSIYNWEIFFHIPLLVADRLSKNQRFEEAQRWFHYIFDPTNTSDPYIIRLDSPRAVYWRVKPFFEEAKKWRGSAETLEDMMRRLATGSDELEEQVNVWRNDPFNPHRIARMRLLAYMKTVVQKYLDNLIAWGDHLFQQDTMESINEAIQLYILAVEILGARPAALNREETEALTYSDVREHLDAFSNLLVDIETSQPVRLGRAIVSRGSEIPSNFILYFCIPSNEKLLSYWDTVADRLFKVRHCMNIEGQVRQLPLFAPPIDPALLVRARAAGLDLGEVISGALDVRLPIYRYQVLIQKAIEFCGEVRSLGGALLAALEKKDAEDLALLRSRHEVSMLKLVKLVKDRQIEEANETLEGLGASRKLAEKRLEFYSSREFMSASETNHTDQLHEGHRYEITGAAVNLAASIAAVVPDFTISAAPSSTFGGSHVSRALSAIGQHFGFIASQYSFEASMALTMAGYYRRQDDWSLQADLAKKEIDQIDRQILAAQVRVAIAELDKSNHEKQIEQAEQVEGFLKSKFTSAQLYSWMIAQVSALHYQAYRMAYDLAKKAEKAAQHELGTDGEGFNYIQFGHWDSLRKGLLAGDRLHQDLRRMELAYLDKNRREFELVKHVSLRQSNPLALLALKATGTCGFIIPEWLFDLDCPGHYMRRVKNVGLSIPAVTGPYTSVNCTLSLLKSSVRTTTPNGTAYPRISSEDNRFVDYGGPVQSVVTSSGNNDSGLFETNLRDERYLPFEGAGAESTWKLELPNEFRQFDYSTISDVILHMRYTARYGSDQLRGDATTYLETVVQSASDGDLALLLHLKNDFPTEWHRFSTSAEIENFSATVTRDYFPYFIAGRNITPRELQLYVVQEKPPELVAGGSINLPASETELPFQLSVRRAAILPLAPQAQIFALLKYSMGSNMSSVS